ncbi:hypothetical protein K435DRAFT_773496 [Dendrothele bispora CBS 962.96]|uniref:Uncharacterized protein n=1 Tax=Dendrothele bispora (strain CBS 962.96) TaxID=1314807 RepID=A0A4S8MS80_DENBC|nr:hypothetical protein K435DRAFT_773496 [Dendrothele bispora CBS 962.96]
MNGINLNHLTRSENDTNHASTSSNPYPDFATQQNNYDNSQKRPSQSQPVQSLWQHQQQPQQLTQQWDNQATQYFGALSGMGGMGGTMANGVPMNMGMSGFSMPFLTQQFWQDALALSAPVVATDEPLLVSALVESRFRRENYKDALNNLHGKNSHSASLWKDYYLEHRDHLDEQVSIEIKKRELEGKPLKTAKKPALNSFKDTSSSPPVRSSSPGPASARSRGRLPKASSKPSTSRTASSEASTPVHDFQVSASGKKRQTINSLTVHTPVYNQRLPPPNSQIVVPEPPSRSPSPPTKIVPHVRGNRFTEEDREFFIKFVSWRLKVDPSLGRNELCDQLEEKAPHHTSASWQSYWSNHHDLPDKILANAHAQDWEEGEEEEEEEEGSETHYGRRVPRYKEISSDEEEEDNDHSSDDENEDITIPLSFDESAMGPSGTSFTNADFAIVAKHISTFPDIYAVSFKDKWETFHKRHPQRSAKSWAEFFRREEKRLMKLAKKLREQDLATVTKSEPLQERKISWDAGGDITGPPKAKRKFIADEKDENGNQSKISRVEVTNV